MDSIECASTASLEATSFARIGVIKFEDLVNMDDPESVFSEVLRLVDVIFQGLDFRYISKTFQDVVRLFRGRYPGYCRCNIFYHDLKHTTDCLMAMTRILHGAHSEGMRFEERDVNLGIVAALLHDTGYIQSVEDTVGTGAKYTLVHIDRSIAFLERYFSKNGNSAGDFRACRDFLRCTGLDVSIEDIEFESETHSFIGRALGAADLLGQMADRTYLERLPLLYREFREGNVPGFDSELDLLKNTPDFWEFTKKRFDLELGNVDNYMVHHFRTRWGLDRDLYREAIETNMRYLHVLLANHEIDYRKYLRRGGVIAKLAEPKPGHRKSLIKAPALEFD